MPQPARTPIDVPAEFAELGYSGLFHLKCSFTDGATTDQVDTMRRKAPCLTIPGWMLLTVDEDGVGTLVRRDLDAVTDILLNGAVTP